MNGGVSGPGKAGAIVLEDVTFDDVHTVPKGDFVSDTDQITTFARGDGWYTYTGPPNHWILPNDIVFVVQTAESNFAKLRFLGYYVNNETKEGSGHITIEYVLQDDGSRNLVETDFTDVQAKQKLTTTWAELKTD